MKTVWMVTLIVSSVLLAAILVKRKLPAGWLTRFGAHLALSAMAIYALNYSGWVTGLYIPLNPVTIGAVTLLGLPGIALIAGLQYTLLA
ncbi:pro-sigmaK processing inhibitor BofA [Cohnella sp. CFH 77786]|uniref:pro-sigmaK processing inhibitor BofA family protein n=1 Tax=Cohnella sp. CFH 77786 TaxID=2662265 RepID=UPI001C60A7EE|nr:pro-sigmaK processing inhibitor BofA family protein [Cohnella sp. CFH 77786]MBW5448709.1 pro-sigmaK processing inhibitor BofA [Cohnella sp. CFH 77786]